MASILDKIRVNRLRWLGHVLRRDVVEEVRLLKEMCVEEEKGRGRPKNS